MISAELEERQLVDRFVGLRPSHHDKARGPRPPEGLLAKLGDFDALAGTYIPQVRQLAFDGRRQASDDDEAGSSLFEPLNHAWCGRKTFCPRGR